MIDKKIEEIVQANCESDRKRHRARLAIKSLLKEYAMDIVGKDENPAIYGVWNPLSAKGVQIKKKIMDDKDTLARNKLRAEQREKLSNLLKEKL